MKIAFLDDSITFGYGLDNHAARYFLPEPAQGFSLLPVTAHKRRLPPERAGTRAACGRYIPKLTKFFKE